MPNDIEYPQPDAIVGPSFHAGGEYDLRGYKEFFRDGKIIKGTEILARLTKNGTGVKDSGPFDPAAADNGTWDVGFTDAPTNDNPYGLQMVIKNGSTEAVADDVSNVTVVGAADGKFNVVEVP